MTKPLRDADYRTLSNFRHALRGFVVFSQQAAVQAGLKPQQHQALLAVRAALDGTMLVGQLADRLKLRPHSATGLVDRLVALGLLDRTADAIDRRQVRLSLTRRAEDLLASLSEIHRSELRRIRPLLQDLLDQM